MIKDGMTSDGRIFVERTTEIFLELLNILENDLKIFTDRLDDDKATAEKALNEIQSQYLRLIRAMNQIENVTRQELRNMAIPTMFWYVLE